MKRKGSRGEGVWLGTVCVSGLVFLDVVSEASLFPSDGEADVFVEVYVAVGSNVNVVDLFVVSISFHCLRVAECFCLPSFRPWTCRFDAESFQKVFDVFEEL
jgi:hypothetical protein